jgi:hypothetical protein
MYRAGHLFTPEGDGLTGELARLLRQHGLQQVPTRAHTLEYYAGTPEGQSFFEENRLSFRNLVPFFQKWSKMPEDYETLYQQMLRETQLPDFMATWNLLTTWGYAPLEKPKDFLR